MWFLSVFMGKSQDLVVLFSKKKKKILQKCNSLKSMEKYFGYNINND